MRAEVKSEINRDAIQTEKTLYVLTVSHEERRKRRKRRREREVYKPWGASLNAGLTETGDDDDKYGVVER